MRRLVVVAFAAALVVGAPGIAWASTDADADAGTAVYRVDISDVSTGPDGAQETETSQGEITIACTARVCGVVTEPGSAFLRGIALTAGPTVTGAAQMGAAGSPCSEGRGARAIDVSATPTGFSATLVQDPVDWSPCEDGSEAYAHARAVTWTGTIVSADTCVFAPEGCVRAATATASALASGDAAAPSVLSALATPAQAGTAPAQLAWAAVLTVILALLVAFPTALLNSATEAGAERLTDWRQGRRDRRAAGGTPSSSDTDETDPAPARTSWHQSWWWAAVGVVAASIISAFVDPQFGFNPGSGRVLLSLLIGFAVDVVVGWALVVLIMRKVLPQATHSYAFQPLTLTVVVAAVVFTRVTGFEPGIVFGLVAGVTFGAMVGRAQEAKAALVSLGYAFGIAVVAWLLYGVCAPLSGESLAGTLLVETLSATAIGGMAALPIALVPLRGLAGHAIWAWNRWVWAGCYAVGLLAFFIVLLPMPFSWEEVSLSLGGWITLYLLYAVVAVVAWLVLARPWRKDSGDEASAAEVVSGAGTAVAAGATADRLEE